MKQLQTNYSFTDLKMKTYKFMLPFLIIASTIAIILENLNDYNSFFNRVALPTLLVWLVFVYLLIFRLSPKKFLYIEYLTFLFVSGLFGGKFWVAIHYEFGVNGLYMFGEFFNWIPLFFIFIYFTFDGKRALVVSLGFLVITTIISIDYILFGNFDRFSISPIIQFHLSNIVYVIALYFLQKLKQVYLQVNALDKMSNTDFLTDLPNRRYMHSLLLHELKKESRVSIILFDIDDFKNINDQYGHDIGDLALIKLSETIKIYLGDKGVLGRWGGEEFLIILSNTSPLTACEIAKEIQSLLEQTNFDQVGFVTSSFGVTGEEEHDSIQMLLNRADKALYEAKENGKNQVCVG
ncbi:GGDEF domain-containing protein [Bacillus sp. JJ1566]|uniref:GGDEF domain-containing protein n=1 Tax=Bacillus sp. JJ1566 TaxID=3122961 RepID=UPI002FFDF84D